MRVTATSEAMLVTYTKKELARIFTVSPRTIEDDARYLGIKPTIGDRNTNLYSQADYDLISQLREHCKIKNNSRESFIPESKVEIVEEQPKVSQLAKVTKVSTVIQNYSDSLEQALQNDPLFDLELLQRISDNKWMLPAKRLAPLLGVKPKTLNNKKRYDYCSFICTKVTYVRGMALWQVEANNS